MNGYLTERAADFLLVTSDHNTVSEVRHSVQQAKIANRVHHVGDTAEALTYMQREGPYMLVPIPGVVLLDAGLPEDKVRGLIRDLKTDPQFMATAVVLITTPDAGQQHEVDPVPNADGTLHTPIEFLELTRVLVSMKTLSLLLVQSIAPRV